MCLVVHATDRYSFNYIAINTSIVGLYSHSNEAVSDVREAEDRQSNASKDVLFKDQGQLMVLMMVGGGFYHPHRCFLLSLFCVSCGSTFLRFT